MATASTEDGKRVVSADGVEARLVSEGNRKFVQVRGGEGETTEISFDDEDAPNTSTRAALASSIPLRRFPRSWRRLSPAARTAALS
jgi:hypothetical protein